MFIHEFKWHRVLRGNGFFKYISNVTGASDAGTTSLPLMVKHTKLTMHWQLLTLQSIYNKERNVTRDKNFFFFFF